MAPIIYSILTACVGAAASGGVLYLCVLLTFAARRRAPLLPSKETPRLVVLVPAHNEEQVLAHTLNSLTVQTYPAACAEIVVIADNCTDSTTVIAHAAGVTVWERVNKHERGKGFALDWALSQLLARPEPADAFVIIDADTEAAPDLLRRMADAFAAHGGAEQLVALQGRYGVLNDGEGWRASLMAGAFDLVNHVRPLGRDARGLSVGLKGNGMLFGRALLQRARWRGDSVTEDLDFALLLAREHGVRVGYVPEALVKAQMPTTAGQASSQRSRWEGGRYALVRERAMPLLAEGLRQRSLLLTDCALDLLCPPLAELAALLCLWAAVVGWGAWSHLLPGAWAWAIACGAAWAGLIVYVLGGLHVSGAGANVYLSLLRAPFYAVWKLALLALRPFAHKEWVRTERTPIAPKGKNL